ncbi:MAG: hypothetical protein ABIK28_09295 [Planctomycetota bacterium]
MKIIISPDRQEFLELGSFLGSLGKEQELYFWNSRFTLWTYYTWGDTTVIALEAPANSPGEGDITQGLRMDEKEKTGMVQHGVQQATSQFIKACFGRRLHKILADGLAMNMVIDLYDQNNVRAGGGSGSGFSVAPSRFYIGSTSPSCSYIRQRSHPLPRDPTSIPSWWISTANPCVRTMPARKAWNRIFWTGLPMDDCKREAPTLSLWDRGP